MEVNVAPISLESDTITGKLIPEEWRDIAGYEGKYVVSNYGRVYSIARTRRHPNSPSKTIPVHGKLLKQNVHYKGYIQYHLCKNCIDTIHKAHRLVAKAFIPNPNNYLQVNHKKGIKSLNYAWELEWCSQSMNIQHSYDFLNRPKANQDHLKKPVYQLSFDGFLIGVFESLNQAMRETGIKHIKTCVWGLRKSAGGYKWSY